MDWHSVRCWAFVILLMIVGRCSCWVTQSQLDGIINKTELQVQNFTNDPNNKTIFGIIGVQNLSLSEANFSTLRKTLSINGGKVLFDSFTFGDIITFLNLTQHQGLIMTIKTLLQTLDSKLVQGSIISNQPVVIAAFRKGITVTQVSQTGIISLAIQLTGFTIPIIQKLYKISDNDLANAIALPFGGLPAYVNQTMGVQSQLKHFLTMSLDSITKAMLIHKNQTEGTLDFIKDFRFIARNVTIGDIKAVYNINNTVVNASSLFVLSNVISGIDMSQFHLALGFIPGMNLTIFNIGEIAGYLNLNSAVLDQLSIVQIRIQFVDSIRASMGMSMQPVAIAAFRKGMTINQISVLGVIDLAKKVTGFTIPIMQKLYKISDNDLANAIALPFGGLPAYVNQTMGVQSQLKHFLTMSLDSITKAMLIHKNQTEGTLDFIKDFRFIARNVTIGDIKAVYNINNTVVNASSLVVLSNVISGIDMSQFHLALGFIPGMNLTIFNIGEIAGYLNLNSAVLDQLSIVQIRIQFVDSIRASMGMSMQPVAIAAFRKGMTINQISVLGVIDLAKKVTGFTIPIMQKLYKISDNDLANAIALPFGGLPAYVNQTMGVQSQLKHFLTMSLDSITKAMLIHKNQTEGTLDFIKDFRFIARNVTIGDIKAVYNINNTVVNASSLVVLSNVISGIDMSQFHLALGFIPGMNLTIFNIGEIAGYLNLNSAVLDQLSIVQIRIRFAKSVESSIVNTLQPVAVAAFRKGMSINQMSMLGVIDLAAKMTGFTVTIIQKMYRISDVDFANAKALPFGGLPDYVNKTTGVLFQQKHFNVMSLDSIYKAFLLHKDIAKGRIDFKRDVNTLMSGVDIETMSKVFGVGLETIRQGTLNNFLDRVAGTNLSDVTNYSAKQVSILSSFTFEEGLYFLLSRGVQVAFEKTMVSQFMQSVITKSQVVSGFFESLNNLVSVNIMQTSIYALTLRANVTERTVHQLLMSSFISVSYYEHIKRLTLQEASTNRILSISPQNIEKATMMKVLQSIRNLKVFARLPFVAAAFYNGMQSTNLTTSSVSSTIHRVLGFDVLTVSKEMKIKANMNVLMSLSAVTFKQLAMQLSGLFRTPVSYKQLYHISVYNLLDAVLTRNSANGTRLAVDEAIRYTSLQMKLRDIGRMYGINHPNLINSTLVSLLISQSDVQGSEVASALNMSLVQEKLLTRVRIVDAQILLGIGDGILDMTTERIGHRIINLNVEIVTLFTPIEELLRAKNLSLANLQVLKLPYMLSSISSGQINQIFMRLNISKVSQSFLFAKSMAEISSARSLQLSAFGKWHIFMIFWDFKRMITIERDACKKFTTPCIANADCYDPVGFIFCRCIDGLSGNQTHCYDGCRNNQCPSGSTCVNIPGGSIKCRCAKPGHRIVNNKCVAKLGRIIKVAGLKFNQRFQDSYKDTNGESFKAKAAEIEGVLTIVICNRIIGCIGISVVSIKPGSIVVDYSVIIDQGYGNVTEASVLEVSKNSLDDEQMSTLLVNRSSALSAEQSNVCDMGGHDCDANAKCIPSSDGSSYTCQCNDGYEKDGNKCEEESNNTAIIVGVVVAVCFVALIVILVIICKKKHADGKLFSVLKGSRHSSTVDVNHSGIENKTYEMQKV